MANQTKSKPAAKAQPKVEEQETELNDIIDLFDVSSAVDRTLKHPDTDEEKSFIQHEMSFMTKLKFFRLLSGTIRIAAEADNPQGGVSSFLDETLGGLSGDFDNPNEFITTILKLVELVPDFAEETYLYALNVKRNDYGWATEALECLDDDEGIDILEVFVAQNGPSIKDFFTKRLPKVGKTVGALMTIEDTEQESEDTTS